MSFIEDLVDYVEDNTTLVIDTDLFIGADQPDTPYKCVLITEFAGGGEDWSGHKTKPVQVLAKDLTYLTAQALAETVYALFQNMAGFSETALSDVLFCEVLNVPFPVGRDGRGCYIFSSNFLFRMK